MGDAATSYTIIDEVAAYIFSWDLAYFSHAKFITYLPGPWQNLIGFVLINAFGSVKALYFFWVGLGTGYIYLVYWFVRKARSKSIALLVSFIMAVFPWPLEFSTKFWNPLFVIPLVTLALGFLLDILRVKKSKKAFFLSFLYCCMPFFHMMSIFTLPGLFYILFKNKEKINWRYLTYGALWGLVLYIPCIYKDIQNGYYMLLEPLSYFENSTSGFRIEAFKVIINALIIITHDVSRFLGHSEKTYFHFLNYYFGHYTVGLALILPSLFLALYAWVGFINKSIRKKFSSDRIFLIFIGFSAGLYFLLFRQHDIRYTNIWWPIIFLILADAIHKLWALSNECSKPKKVTIQGLVVLYFALGMYLSATVPYHQTHGNYKEAVRQIQSIIAYERIERAILKSENIEIINGPRRYPFLKKPLYKQDFKLEASFHSQIHYFTNHLVLKVYFENSEIDKRISERREKFTFGAFAQYVNYNNWINVVNNLKEADIVVKKVDKDKWNKKHDISYKVIEELPNCYLLKKLPVLE